MYFTDVDYVTFTVKHNVSIVPVFELQQERQQTVAGHADDEVPTSLQTNHHFTRVNL